MLNKSTIPETMVCRSIPGSCTESRMLHLRYGDRRQSILNWLVNPFVELRDRKVSRVTMAQAIVPMDVNSLIDGEPYRSSAAAVS
jgi:hypothetical protein